MAGDWIKMRAALCTHPKVLLIAEIIGSSPEVGRRMSTGFNGALDEIVSSDVTRDVTLAALLRVWCATNEHTDDGVWHNSTLKTLDHAAGIPGFGAAMAEAEWAICDEEKGTVTLPNFLENNAPAKNNARSTSAERQARYRAKKALRDAQRNATRDVTLSVTSNAREEKRREEHTEPNGSDAHASPTDRDMVFANGVALLTAAGLIDKNARSFLAAQCKAHGEAAVKAALDRCAAERPIQPVPWLTAALGPANASTRPRKSDTLMAGNIAAAHRFLTETPQ